MDELDDDVWLRLTEWITLKGSTFGPVGGTAVFDAVLARAGQRLAAGDVLRDVPQVGLQGRNRVEAPVVGGQHPLGNKPPQVPVGISNSNRS